MQKCLDGNDVLIILMYSTCKEGKPLVLEGFIRTLECKMVENLFIQIIRGVQ